MIRLTKYHDHIVNLQGLTYTTDKENKCVAAVSNLIIFNSSNSFIGEIYYIFVIQSFHLYLKYYFSFHFYWNIAAKAS